MDSYDSKTVQKIISEQVVCKAFLYSTHGKMEKGFFNSNQEGARNN